MKGNNLSYTGQDRQYWRRRGNRRVRRARLTRAVLRWSLISVLNLALLALLVFVAARAIRHAAGSPEFSLVRIQVEGTVKADPVAIENSLRPLLGASLFEIELPEVARQVEQWPWVARADVKRILPGSMRVTVTERVPFANALIDGQAWVIDRQGVVICRAGAGAAFDLPVVTGLDRLEEPRLEAALRRAAFTLRRLEEVHGGWIEGISEIDIERTDRVVVTTVRPGPKLLLDADQVERNISQYLALSDEIENHVGPAEYVDLRWRHSISVMPGAGS